MSRYFDEYEGANTYFEDKSEKESILDSDAEELAEDAIDEIFLEELKLSKDKVEKVIKLMELIFLREADFIDLYFFRGLRQSVIAEIFNVSQPTICYRLQRAVERIKFLLEMPDVTDDDLKLIICKYIANDLDKEIMFLMYKKTCQSEVAKYLGITQSFVRHRFMRSIRRLKRVALELSEGLKLDLEIYIELFEKISNNLNILKEVKKMINEEPFSHIVDSKSFII